jgi:DNA helicase-2/ATP-dependent DNA helicase PcrA
MATMQTATTMQTSELAMLVGLPTASSYQTDIFAHVKDALAKRVRKEPFENVFVVAVAGAGKTTTIVACTRLFPEKNPWGTKFCSIFLAFNVRAKNDLRKKLPQTIDCATLNSQGNRIWSKYVQGAHKVWPELKKFKVSNILRGLVKAGRLSQDELNEHGAVIRFLIGQCKQLGIVPSGMRGWESLDGLTDSNDVFFQILSHHDQRVALKDADLVFGVVRDALRLNNEDEKVIDFDDQLYFPVCKRTTHGATISCFQFDAVVVDEAQDVNPVQLALLHMIRKANGLLIAVGDHRQSIYGFRGADIYAVQKIRDRFRCTEKPLSITYRCARSIVEHAQEIYPDIQAAPNAPEGVVEFLSEWSIRMFNADTDIIMCRNNAPLISLAYKFISARIPVAVLGRDLGAGIIDLINKFPHDGSLLVLAEEAAKWLQQQLGIINVQNPDDEEAKQRITDKYECLSLMLRESTAQDVPGLIAEINALFGEQFDDEGNLLIKGKIVLSTVHKMKGGEAENIYVLNDYLFYPKWIQPGTWQHVQESNLVYVARTRAKSGLFYIYSEEMAEAPLKQAA